MKFTVQFTAMFPSRKMRCTSGTIVRWYVLMAGRRADVKPRPGSFTTSSPETTPARLAFFSSATIHSAKTVTAVTPTSIHVVFVTTAAPPSPSVIGVNADLGRVEV
jgi:hypothetical protein